MEAGKAPEMPGPSAKAATPQMPGPGAKAATQRFSGLRKVAIVLTALGEDLASEIFKHLNETEVHEVLREISELQQLTSEQTESVMDEFHHLNLARAYSAGGGFEYAHKLLIKAFGGEQAKRLLDRVTLSKATLSDYDLLENCDPQQLSKLIRNESNQTIALTLAHVKPNIAAETLGLLPEEIQGEVILRIAGLQDVSQDMFRRIALVLGKRLRTLDNYTRQSIGGVRAVAELFNHFDRTQGRKLLDDLGESHPDLALSVRSLMVTFDDVMLVDNNGIREIISRVDKKALALALKGTSPELQNRFFSNMSQRAAEMMREEMEYMGAVKLKEVNKAQQEIIDIMSALDDEGIISLSGGGEDQYVS